MRLKVGCWGGRSSGIFRSNLVVNSLLPMAGWSCAAFQLIGLNQRLRRSFREH